MDYVTDTHSLVWYFTDDPRLGDKALKAFEQTAQEGIIIIPSIVLAEIIFISKKGRITPLKIILGSECKFGQIVSPA